MMRTRRPLVLISAIVVTIAAVLGDLRILNAWGAHGHTISGAAAARALPREMPKFFRNAADQLAYLTPEPDRWRNRGEAERDPAMNGAFAPDHFINFERIPESAWQAEDRFAFMADVRAKTGMVLPEAGLSPFHILELFQRLRVAFGEWRAAPDGQTRRWIEQRIVNDAGLLGHYVTDGANPLHTTIHHHGWIGENPKKYATDREIHARFEGRYVQAQVKLGDLMPHMSRPPRVVTEPRRDILAFLRESHTYVDEFYTIDQRAPFNELTTAPENKQFTVARLVFGAQMLRDLWWTAWVTSVDPRNAAPPPPRATGTRPVALP